MADKIGKLPIPQNPFEALREIQKIARDKRSHVLCSDQCEWLELKLKAISTLAHGGIKTEPFKAPS